MLILVVVVYCTFCWAIATLTPVLNFEQISHECPFASSHPSPACLYSNILICTSRVGLRSSRLVSHSLGHWSSRHSLNLRTKVFKAAFTGAQLHFNSDQVYDQALPSQANSKILLDGKAVKDKSESTLCASMLLILDHLLPPNLPPLVTSSVL